VLAQELVLKSDPSDTADVVDGQTTQDVDAG
jgi:hypothetical protein